MTSTIRQRRERKNGGGKEEKKEGGERGVRRNVLVFEGSGATVKGTPKGGSRGKRGKF